MRKAKTQNNHSIGRYYINNVGQTVKLISILYSYHRNVFLILGCSTNAFNLRWKLKVRVARCSNLTNHIPSSVVKRKGTVLFNEPVEIFQQCKFLDNHPDSFHGIIFSLSFFQWSSKLATPILTKLLLASMLNF